MIETAYLNPQPKAQAIKHISTVMHEFLQQIPSPLFDKTVERHQGDYRVRKLNCWTQLVALHKAKPDKTSNIQQFEMLLA